MIKFEIYQDSLRSLHAVIFNDKNEVDGIVRFKLMDDMRLFFCDLLDLETDSEPTKHYTLDFYEDFGGYQAAYDILSDKHSGNKLVANNKKVYLSRMCQDALQAFCFGGDYGHSGDSCEAIGLKIISAEEYFAYFEQLHEIKLNMFDLWAIGEEEKAESMVENLNVSIAEAYGNFGEQKDIRANAIIAFESVLALL